MKKKAKSTMLLAVMIPIIVLDILFRGEKSSSSRFVY